MTFGLLSALLAASLPAAKALRVEASRDLDKDGSLSLEEFLATLPAAK